MGLREIYLREDYREDFGFKMKITVGVPIFNQKLNFFRECLESVKSQTYQDFECIVLDDGSDKKEEVEKITKEFGFKYIYQKNAGIGAARQAIIDNASKETKFIAQLSSDDIWDDKFLETMIQKAQEQSGKILYSTYYLINDDSEIMGGANVPIYDNPEDFCIACFEVAYKNNMFVNFSTTFFPKEVFKKVQFDKNKIFGEDLDFLLKSMKDFEYHFVPGYLLKYRVGDTTTTSKIRLQISTNNEKTIKSVREYWEHE